MGIKLPPKDMELYTRVDEVLHYVWDPIRVSGIPNARDEYQIYLPQIFSMVKDRAADADIANYLDNIITSGMGLSSNKEHCLNVASILSDWRDALVEKYMNT